MKLIAVILAMVVTCMAQTGKPFDDWTDVSSVCLGNAVQIVKRVSDELACKILCEDAKDQKNVLWCGFVRYNSLNKECSLWKDAAAEGATEDYSKRTFKPSILVPAKTTFLPFDDWNNVTRVCLGNAVKIVKDVFSKDACKILCEDAKDQKNVLWCEIVRYNSSNKECSLWKGAAAKGATGYYLKRTFKPSGIIP